VMARPGAARRFVADCFGGNCPIALPRSDAAIAIVATHAKSRRVERLIR
jgi:hypothetical protein